MVLYANAYKNKYESEYCNNEPLTLIRKIFRIILFFLYCSKITYAIVYIRFHYLYKIYCFSK